MTVAEALRQLARLVGREAFEARVGSAASFDAATHGRALQALVDERLQPLVDGLLEEALASDDVFDAPTAEAFLDDRLTFLGDLLTEPQRRAVRTRFGERLERWR